MSQFFDYKSFWKLVYRSIKTFRIKNFLRGPTIMGDVLFKRDMVKHKLPVAS